MNNEPYPEKNDPLAEMLHEAFPEEPVPNGLAARIVAAVENPTCTLLRPEDDNRKLDRRRAAVTAVSATICGLILGLTLGLSAFNTEKGLETVAIDTPCATYLALLSGYTDIENE